MAIPQPRLWALLGALAILGCNGGSSRTPLAPSDPTGSAFSPIGGHYDRSPIVWQTEDSAVMPLQRMQLRVGPNMEAELIPLREANAFGQLLVADIDQLITKDHIRMRGITWSPERHLVVDLEVEHPFPAPDLNAPVGPLNRADLHANHLRAILFLDGNQSFSTDSGTVTMSPAKLVNADGYTNQMPPPPGSSVTATHFPYVVFGTENPAQLGVGNYHTTDAGGLGWNFIPLGETKNVLEEPIGFNVFRQGGLLRGTFVLNALPGESFALDLLFVVNYAPAARNKATRLQAEYFLPATAPQEAWRVTVDKIAGGLEAGYAPADPLFNKTATFEVNVYDWQHGRAFDVVSDYPRSNFRVGLAAASDVASVKVKIPALMPGTLDFPVSNPFPPPPYGTPLTWEFTIDNTGTEAPEGTYYGLVEVVDTRVPDVDFDTLGDSKSVFGVEASTLEFRTLPAFRTYQVFPVRVGEGNLPPVAAAIATSSTSILQGQTVTFESQSTDPNGDTLTLEWDFNGDGIFGHPVLDNFTGTPENPTHTFLAPGSFNVNLRVNDGRGGVDTLDLAGTSPFIRIPVNVTAQNIPPVACYTTSDLNYLLPGALVTFDATCTFDTSSPLNYEWDFDGDGTFGDAWHPSSPNPPVVVVAQYPTAGAYVPRLRVSETATVELYSTIYSHGRIIIRNPNTSLLNPVASPRYFGKVIAVGDLNNDNADDLVIAATGFHNVPTQEVAGRLYIFYNKLTSPPYSATPDVIITAPSTQGDAGYGWCIDIGDVDGDGWNDIAVGAFQRNLSQTYQGYVEVIMNGGLAAAPLHFRPNGTAGRPDNFFAVNNPTPQNGSESYGNAVKFADLDQDGRDDLVVGAYAAQRPGGHWQAGEMYAFLSTGFDMVLSATLQKFPYYTADYLGTGLAVGDFDGDGDLDIVGGAPGTKIAGVSVVGAVCYWENRLNEPGFDYPYIFGGNETNTQIQQNWMGIPPQLVGDGSFGQVMTAADLNGNGFDDLIVGAPGYYTGNMPIKAGAVFIYHGNSNFSNALPPHAQMVVSAYQDYRAFFGTAIAVGELTGDTLLDLVVGSPFRDETITKVETGMVEVFRRQGTQFVGPPTVLTPSVQPEGGESGYAVGVGNIYSGSSTLEVVYGAPRQDTYPTGPGRLWITDGPY